jgi:hypothetical protein
VNVGGAQAVCPEAAKNVNLGVCVQNRYASEKNGLDGRTN